VTQIELFAGEEMRVLDTVTRPARISAHDGAVAWSDYRRGSYRLVVRAPGERPRELPGLARRSLPLEFDLGPAPGGGTAIVYSRCRFRLRDCDLFMQRLGEWEEEPVPGANTRRFSEVRPAIWGDLVTFARIANGGRTRAAPDVRLYLRRLSQRGRSRRLPGGPRGDLPPPGDSGLEGTDLGPRGVVFTWISRSPGTTHYRVLVDGLRGGQRLIDEEESAGDVRQLHSASISGGTVSYLSYAFSQGAPEDFELHHFGLPDGARTRTALPCAVVGAAADGRRFAFLHATNDCPGRPPGPPRFRVLYGARPASDR
jgi:hypothetical protein